jgi:ribonuclease HI
MKKTKKFYAVARGRNPGIYTQWFGEAGAEAQVKGFVGARFKGFVTLDEARQWLENPDIEPPLIQADLPLIPSRPLSPEPAQKNQSRSKPQRPGDIILYTDGACTNNPGPGGYGTVIINGGTRVELSGGYRMTTNNRMELTAIIKGLASLETPSRVTVYSDSKYVVDAVTKGWAKKWRSRDWFKYDGKPAKNPDLWARLLDLLDIHDVTLVWVRGHAGNIENECCDRLAVAAAHQTDLPPDPGYEQGLDNPL